MNYQLFNDDCLNALKRFQDNYFDSIVSDPPSGISFMGKDWDHDKGGRDKWIAWMQEIATECLRVLKPGGHATIWALPRTCHWTATAWENAGFEVRDRISHIFGSGFPKSYNVSKGIEGLITNGSASWNDFHKLEGKKGKTGGKSNGYVKISAVNGNRPTEYKSHGTVDLEPTTDEAKQWEGWGTALKPAMEDWLLLRKPISEKTVAANVLKWGTGAINIDASRVPGEAIPINKLPEWSGFGQLEKPEYETEVNTKGRWPSQIIHDGSEEVVSMFPDSKTSRIEKPSDCSTSGNTSFDSMRGNRGPRGYDGEGSAARFFYCAKPSQAEKNEGITKLEKKKKSNYSPNDNGEKGLQSRLHGAVEKEGNHHPTVKPKALMKYLITLITPPGGVVLDCFMGSGTTGVCSIELGHPFVGIEKDTENGYFQIAEAKLLHASRQEKMF